MPLTQAGLASYATTHTRNIESVRQISCRRAWGLLSGADTAAAAG